MVDHSHSIKVQLLREDAKLLQGNALKFELPNLLLVKVKYVPLFEPPGALGKVGQIQAGLRLMLR